MEKLVYALPKRDSSMNPILFTCVFISAPSIVAGRVCYYNDMGQAFICANSARALFIFVWGCSHTTNIRNNMKTPSVDGLCYYLLHISAIITSMCVVHIKHTYMLNCWKICRLAAHAFKPWKIVHFFFRDVNKFRKNILPREDFMRGCSGCDYEEVNILNLN